MRTMLLVAVASGVASSAFAGPSAPTEPAGPTRPASEAEAAHDGELSADMAATLRKAGFTDLEIMPNSVFVRAKDKAGHPVAMVLNPRSMTEVVTLDPHASTAAAGTGVPMTGSGTFVTVLPTEKLASALIGTTVVGVDDAVVGTVKDMAIDHNGVHAYIVGIGGVFGIGNRYVAVAPGALTLSFDRAKQTYRATMSATTDQLRTAPEFKFKDVGDKQP